MQTMSSMPVSRVVGQPPVSGHEPRRRAQADDPVVVARHADRAAAVGAEAGDRGAAPISAPSPPLEPPLVRAGSKALSVRPWSALSVSYDQAYSGTAVFAATIAPASRSRATTVESVAATLFSRASEPERNGSPATAIVSLIVTGSPSSGAVEPAARAASASAGGGEHGLVVERGDRVQLALGGLDPRERLPGAARPRRARPPRGAGGIPRR